MLGGANFTRISESWMKTGWNTKNKLRFELLNRTEKNISRTKIKIRTKRRDFQVQLVHRWQRGFVVVKIDLDVWEHPVTLDVPKSRSQSFAAALKKREKKELSTKRLLRGALGKRLSFANYLRRNYAYTAKESLHETVNGRKPLDPTLVRFPLFFRSFSLALFSLSAGNRIRGAIPRDRIRI